MNTAVQDLEQFGQGVVNSFPDCAGAEADAVALFNGNVLTHVEALITTVKSIYDSAKSQGDWHLRWEVNEARKEQQRILKGTWDKLHNNKQSNDADWKHISHDIDNFYSKVDGWFGSDW